MNAKIGHYEVVTELGRGGMGVVVKGYEAALNRYVAIKMLSPALADDDSVKERFLREARSMAVLNDPHIIQIYFIGENNGQPYFAMEFVEGESVSSYLKREHRMSPEQAARVIYQTCQGLTTAHDKGVVHRDIKPANLMLNQRGQIKIADFGIALSSTDFSKKLTSTGELVGTPGYLSPEVCVGQAVDQRSDIFSLGIVFFELLTGRMPFTDESPLGLMLEVVRAEIPDVRQINADVDEGLVNILKKMTAKDPAARYQSCHEIIADLNKHQLIVGGNTISATPVLSTAASTVLGMKTPLPGMAQLPRTGSQQMPPAPAPAIAPPPPVQDVRPSVLDSQQKKSSSAGLWSIAAVLALAVLGGTGWMLRDKISFGSASTASTPVTSESAISGANTPSSGGSRVPSSSTASNPPNSGSPNSSGSNATSGPTNSGPNSGATTASSNPSGNTASNGADPSANSGTVANNGGTSPANQGNSGGDNGTAPQPIAGVPGDRLAGDGRALGALKRMADAERAALAANNGPGPIATPPRPMGPPKVAVIRIGDPSITGPAAQMIERSLTRSGYILVDTDMVPGLQRLLDHPRPDLPQVLNALAQAANVRAVTVVRAEPLGSTPISFYGQTDTLNSAQLSVRSYDVGNRSPLGAGLRTKIDFTQLNAEEKAREAVEPELDEVVNGLAEYKPRTRGG